MKLSTLLRLGRVSNLPTVWTNVLAGVTLGGASAHSAPERIGLLCGAVSLFYIGGMYLNDAFDREIDARERPERPIPSGEISAGAVFAIGYGLLAAGLALVAVLALSRAGTGWPPVGAALALAVAIVFYDAYHKDNPLSPVVMGINRVLVYVLAALSVRASFTPALLLGCGALLSYLIGLTYVAKQENLREVRGMWPLVLLAVPFAHVQALQTPTGALLYVMLGAWVAFTLSLILRQQGRDIPRAVGQFIAGICLLDGLLVAGQGQPVLAALCIVGFAVTRVFQRRIPGT